MCLLGLVLSSCTSVDDDDEPFVPPPIPCERDVLIDVALRDVDAPGFYLLSTWGGDVEDRNGCGSVGPYDNWVWIAPWDGTDFETAVRAADFTVVSSSVLTFASDADGLLMCGLVEGTFVSCAARLRAPDDVVVATATKAFGFETHVLPLLPEGGWEAGYFDDVELVFEEAP